MLATAVAVLLILDLPYGFAIVELTPWHQAACQGDVAELATRLSAGQPLEDASLSGHTALLYAVSHNRFAAAKFLLEQGADAAVSTLVCDQQHPVHIACTPMRALPCLCFIRMEMAHCIL